MPLTMLSLRVWRVVRGKWGRAFLYGKMGTRSVFESSLSAHAVIPDSAPCSSFTVFNTGKYLIQESGERGAYAVVRGVCSPVVIARCMDVLLTLFAFRTKIYERSLE
jgi:hypothetical protein